MIPLTPKKNTRKLGRSRVLAQGSLRDSPTSKMTICPLRRITLKKSFSLNNKIANKMDNLKDQ